MVSLTIADDSGCLQLRRLVAVVNSMREVSHKESVFLARKLFKVSCEMVQSCVMRL